MKLSILLSGFILFTLGANAQLKPRTVNKKSGSYSYTYHKNGKISTAIFRPKDGGKNGHAIAYNNKGTRIYKKETSRQHMISSVHFTYHENGAVKSAENSWHPDGGIQWGKETTWFDETGKVVNTITQNYDDTVTPVKIVTDAKQEEAVVKIEKKDTVLRHPCDSLISLDYGPAYDTTIENMFRKWHATEFPRLLKKHKMPKIDCGHCSAIVADLKIEIDDAGRIKSSEVLTARGCTVSGDLPEALKQDILNSISTFVFPKHCYNGCFRKRVGRALKC